MLLLTAIKENKLHVPACLPSPLCCAILSAQPLVPPLLSSSVRLPSTSWPSCSFFPGHSLLFFSTLCAAALCNLNCVRTNIHVLSFMSIHYVTSPGVAGPHKPPVTFSSCFSFESCVVFHCCFCSKLLLSLSAYLSKQVVFVCWAVCLVFFKNMHLFYFTPHLGNSSYSSILLMKNAQSPLLGSGPSLVNCTVLEKCL